MLAASYLLRVWTVLVKVSTLTHLDSRVTLSSHALLLGDANDAACWTTTSIARLLALLVATLAEIIRAGVYDDRAAKHALWADQLDVLVLHGTLAIALAVGLEVA